MFSQIQFYWGISFRILRHPDLGLKGNYDSLDHHL